MHTTLGVLFFCLLSNEETAKQRKALTARRVELYVSCLLHPVAACCSLLQRLLQRVTGWGANCPSCRAVRDMSRSYVCVRIYVCTFHVASICAWCSVLQCVAALTSRRVDTSKSTCLVPRTSTCHDVSTCKHMLLCVAVCCSVCVKENEKLLQRHVCDSFVCCRVCCTVLQHH